MDPEQLQIVLGQLAHAYGMPPPPPLTPDQIASGSSLMSQLLATLGLAGNSGDPADAADAAAQHAQRGQQTGDALTKFPANEEQSSEQMQQLMGTFQQIPQQVAQTLSGLVSPFSQGINQAVQSASQMGSQLASSVGKVGQGAGVAAEVPAEALSGAVGAGEDALGAGAGLAGATTPAGTLGPPPTPSAGTVPASSPTTPIAPPATAESAAGARGVMGGGMPMMPAGAAHGATSGSDSKAETKRVVPPTVKNGAPVQGRISAPQAAPEVVKRVAGKPVASRRLLVPDDKRDDDEGKTGGDRS